VRFIVGRVQARRELQVRHRILDLPENEERFAKLAARLAVVWISGGALW
jgi:hypothetical protein